MKYNIEKNTNTSIRKIKNGEITPTIGLLYDLLENTLFCVDKLKLLKKISAEYGIAKEDLKDYMKHILMYLSDVFQEQKQKLPKYVYKFYLHTQKEIHASSDDPSQANLSTSEIVEDKYSDHLKTIITQKEEKIKELEHSIKERENLLKQMAMRIEHIHKTMNLS
ncbi:MAG: hypothetical protein BAJALOKI1v1_430009 [Promethearchaeota archaeon]|nr:MAG: hypothetical protein BAJALOKI1v1_430009 [Candidatus Lokiarchaeota archaeon]